MSPAPLDPRCPVASDGATRRPQTLAGVGPRACAVGLQWTPGKLWRSVAWLALIVCSLILLSLPAQPVAQSMAGSGPAAHLTIDGPIGPATAHHVRRGLEQAQAHGASVLVLQMDTPGGLDTSMREIIREILAAPIPVLSWVGPSGARAASAGTYILYASHVAAMAPGTNLGAATPVSIGGGGGLPLPGRGDNPRGDRPSGDGGGAGSEADGAAPSDASAPQAEAGERGRAQERPAARPGSASEAKAVNDAIAYIRSLAELRGRNADWAEAAVRDAASLSYQQALDQDVIDLVAHDVRDLLRQAHGREVQLGQRSVTLQTQDLSVTAIEPDWRTRLLATITNPNLALILMMIGIYGLIFEFMNPGALVPGTVGAISLLVGLYALSALPLNYAGLGLILLGMALMLAEAFTPSLGILGIGGVISFVLGATLLIDTDAPGYDLSLPLVAGVAAASLGMTLLIARLFIKSRRSRVVSGSQTLVGRTARVVDWQAGRGHVMLDGERWNAVGPQGLEAGQETAIAAVDGLTLTLAPPSR